MNKKNIIFIFIFIVLLFMGCIDPIIPDKKIDKTTKVPASILKVRQGNNSIAFNSVYNLNNLSYKPAGPVDFILTHTGKSGELVITKNPFIKDQTGDVAFQFASTITTTTLKPGDSTSFKIEYVETKTDGKLRTATVEFHYNDGVDRVFHFVLSRKALLGGVVEYKTAGKHKWTCPISKGKVNITLRGGGGGSINTYTIQVLSSNQTINGAPGGGGEEINQELTSLANLFNKEFQILIGQKGGAGNSGAEGKSGTPSTITGDNINFTARAGAGAIPGRPVVSCDNGGANCQVKKLIHCSPGNPGYSSYCDQDGYAKIEWLGEL